MVKYDRPLISVLGAPHIRLRKPKFGLRIESVKHEKIQSKVEINPHEYNVNLTVTFNFAEVQCCFFDCKIHMKWGNLLPQYE